MRWAGVESKTTTEQTAFRRRTVDQSGAGGRFLKGGHDREF
jgi:hypothetical protein